MGKKVILAVAGAGKTYYICHSLDPAKKNLILAFTHENIKNIRNELTDKFGAIPEKTLILTFHAFVYRFLLRPYEPSIFKAFGVTYFKTNGVYLGDPPQKSIKVNSNNYRPNPNYHNVDNINHYLNKNHEYYCDLMTEMLMRLPKIKAKRVLESILCHIHRCYDAVYVDEFQDFRESDYKLLMQLVGVFPDITLVGDFYQHSVAGKNNSGIPFVEGRGNNKRDVTFDEFFQQLQDMSIEVDMTTLQKSRRCSINVCNFVMQKLGISLQGTEKEGNIIPLGNLSSDCLPPVEKILIDDTIPKLVFREANKYSIRCLNWSYAKGDTFKDVCVILTEGIKDICKTNWQCKLKKVTLNKLYVALTRAERHVYLISNKDFKAFISKNNSLQV